MPEVGPEHPITYRQEIAAPLFDRIRAGGSCAVVGAASMGKSRLLQFLLRAEVRRHYLGADAENTLLAWVDCNRMAEISEWGLYELLLTALVEAVEQGEREPLLQLRREAILEHNALLAQRNVEIALKILCQEEELRVVFILDEFDESYQCLSAQTLANRRSLRDMNKYWLTFVLFTRDALDNLRSPDDVQSFYELFSRNHIGLIPYSNDDAQRVIAQQAARRIHQLSGAPTNYALHVCELSGGHPGLIVALLHGLTCSAPHAESWQEWALHLPGVLEECRKLWEGLRVEERRALNHLAHKMPPRYTDKQSLLLKGLIIQQSDRELRIFSPLVEGYAAAQSAMPEATLEVDAATGRVYVNGQPTAEELTEKEFALLVYLYENRGAVCSVGDIISHVYPGPEGDGIFDNTVTALIGRIRKKIEPDQNHWRFLHTHRGRGYRLIVEDEVEKV